MLKHNKTYPYLLSHTIFNAKTPNSSMSSCFSTSIEHNCSDTVIYNVFISKRFASFEFDLSLITCLITL